MKKKLLIVVDMQEDFISGSLGSVQAQAIVPKVQDKIQEYAEFGHLIYFTRDTHGADYLQTQEGKYLPVEHCIVNTEGHKIPKNLLPTACDYDVFDKPNFGSLQLADILVEKVTAADVEEIELIGLCTDICVVSNALILKAKFPEIQITVDAECCAGVSEETHNAALLTMKTCQINIINWKA